MESGSRMVGCVEACLDEILALGPGDALGDRDGARRMGGGVGTLGAIARGLGTRTPWAIERGRGGRGRRL